MFIVRAIPTIFQCWKCHTCSQCCMRAKLSGDETRVAKDQFTMSDILAHELQHCTQIPSHWSFQSERGSVQAEGVDDRSHSREVQMREDIHQVFRQISDQVNKVPSRVLP